MVEYRRATFDVTQYYYQLRRRSSNNNRWKYNSCTLENECRSTASRPKRQIISKFNAESLEDKNTYKDQFNGKLLQLTVNVKGRMDQE